MLKNILELSHKIGDFENRFHCDAACPIGHVKESLFQFLKYVGKVEDEAIKQAEAKQKECNECDKQDCVGSSENIG